MNNIIDNHPDFKDALCKAERNSGLTQYQKGYYHGMYDTGDILREQLEKCDTLAKAAPEMLAALRLCVEIESDARLLEARYGIEIPQTWKDAFGMINSAIAKAKGEQP